MQPVSGLIKESFPNYLANLPIPNTFGGWFKLGVRDWISLIPFGAAVAGVTYLVYKAFCPRAQDRKKSWINPNIRKTEAKVVDMVDVEDISDTAAFCRCWRSKQFPYCDGSHTAFNKETGDNTGPVVVQRKKK